MSVVCEILNEMMVGRKEEKDRKDAKKERDLYPHHSLDTGHQ